MTAISQNQEVLIVGGGVIGLSLARELYKKGVKKITILERGQTGKESSFAAAGMLAPHTETEKADDFFYFCRASNELYPDFAAELFEETRVDIELDRSGTLYLAFTENDSKEIRERFEWQRKSAFPVEYLSANDVRKSEPFVSPDAREGLYFPNDWQVENRKLLVALQKFAEFNRIAIYTKTEVRNLLTENGKIIGAETASQKFFAPTVVLTTGAWTSLLRLENQSLPLPKVEPIRGQIISFRTAKRLFSRVIQTPRGYLVPRGDGRILSGATVEDVGFDKNLTESGIEFLRQNALEISPSLGNLEIYEKWAGLRPRAADDLPILGTPYKHENLFLATAHYRNGILLAPLTAKILAAKITENKDSKYLEVFSPSRFKQLKYLKEKALEIQA
ncbi:MAG TPA: glycine oxidase ThiO [Pyrinomonadaceae bacterium]|nr:glycine oxidase ThiO [Pyrinomonadaceae bacterium]